MTSAPSSPPPVAPPSFPPCVSLRCGPSQLTPAVQILISVCCMFGGLAAFTLCYYLYSGPSRGAEGRPEQQDRSASRTPAQIMRRLSPHLTAVDKASISPGEACAICLGELREAVDRSCHGGDVSPETALAAGAHSGDVSPGEMAAAEARSHASDAPPAPARRVLSALRVRVPGRPAAARSPRGARDPIADGPGLLALRCGHCFHGQCIRAWIIHRGAAGDSCSCPLCKAPLAAIPAGEQAAYV